MRSIVWVAVGQGKNNDFLRLQSKKGANNVVRYCTNMEIMWDLSGNGIDNGNYEESDD